MRVLYVNHTGEVSGGELSLLDLLGALPEQVEPVVAAPDGPLTELLAQRKMQIARIKQVDGSLKLHPHETPRALGHMIAGSWDLARHAKTLQADLVHANSIRAGLLAAGARRLGAPPTLIHIRDALPPGRVASLSLRVATRRAGAIVANSSYTAAKVSEVLGRSDISVAHSPIDTTRFGGDRTEAAATRHSLRVPPRALVLGVVAQLTPWKAQDDAIRMLAQLTDLWPELVLVLVGEAKFLSTATRYDNQMYVAYLHKLVRELGVAERVNFAGERSDIPQVLSAMDLLLLPSWEEPFGRAVVESMAMGTPVLATSVGGTIDIISPEYDGILLSPRDPHGWAVKIDSLLADPQRRETLARNARKTAQRFSVDHHVATITTLYRTILANSGEGARRPS